MRSHPAFHSNVAISEKEYQQLMHGMSSSGYAKEDWEIVAEAIDEWVRRHATDAIPANGADGYQWKS